MTDNNNNTTPLPTFSSLRSAHQLATRSTSAGRLYWTLSDPDISSSISVMPNTHTPDPATLVPFTFTNTTTSPSQQRHPLSQDLMTRPPVRSIHVTVNHLRDRESDWVESHRDHFGPGRQTITVSTEDEADDEDETGGWVKIVGCCGEPRPGPVVPLEVVASDEGKGVTVGDYVAAVHPWLMGLKPEVLAVMAKFRSVGEGTVVMVNVNGPGAVSVETQDEWIGQCRLCMG